MLSFNVRIRNRLQLIYVVTDFITTNLAVFCFNVFRWIQVADRLGDLSVFYRMHTVWGGQIFFPLLMMAIYWLSGYYNHVDLRSRAQEAITTLYSALAGALCIFFLAVVNDNAWRRSIAIESLLVAGALIFLFVYIGRFLITRLEVKRVHERHNINNAIVLGCGRQAVELSRRINDLPKGMGLKVCALVRLHPGEEDASAGEFDMIELTSLRRFIELRGVGHIILSSPGLLRGNEFSELLKLAIEMDVPLFMSPDMTNIAIASHRNFNVLGEPLVCISHPNISDSTVNVKRLVDVIGSAVALTVCLPLFAALALAIKIDSRGPVFFLQDRLGRGGKAFRIIKFRTMVPEAEADGRARVTVDDDPRITRAGRFLRKYRLDELPQFVNVLLGEMSLVGPRPERAVFAEQIARRVPTYPLIYQVRPGITSWGMVRYGYASNVDQMIERLRYDMLYLETISLSTDLKILLHTVNTVLAGRGK